MKIDTGIGADGGGDVLVVQPAPGCRRVRELVADHPPVPAGAQALQDAQVQTLADQGRLEARHRLEAVWGPRGVGGAIGDRVAGGGGFWGGTGALPGGYRAPGSGL